MQQIKNFFGDPNELERWIATLSKEDFLIFLAKKEEQWALLQRTRVAYGIFLEDSNDAYGRDALCMKYIYKEKGKRGL